MPRHGAAVPAARPSPVFDQGNEHHHRPRGAHLPPPSSFPHTTDTASCTGCGGGRCEQHRRRRRPVRRLSHPGYYQPSCRNRPAVDASRSRTSAATAADPPQQQQQLAYFSFLPSLVLFLLLVTLSPVPAWGTELTAAVEGHALTGPQPPTLPRRCLRLTAPPLPPLTSGELPRAAPRLGRQSCFL